MLGMREFSFYPAEAVSRQAEQRRIAALYALLGGRVRVAAASVPGLLQRTLTPELLSRASFVIDSKEGCDPGAAEAALLRCGYSRCDQVEGPGQFARRGGILDFFSPADREPVRVEFWGDELDSMGHFDVASQRRSEPIERCTVLPAAETLPSLTLGGPETLARQIETLAERFARKRGSENAASLAATLRGDAERLRGGVLMSDADRYLPLIYPMACALDYLPENALLVMDQPAPAPSGPGIFRSSCRRTCWRCRSGVWRP